MKLKTQRTLLFSALLTSSLLPTYSLAQAQGGDIEEVLVTAQRRSERLEDVPLSITAVSGEMLEKASVSTIEDIGKISAGVQVDRAGSFTQPAIRGVSTLTLGYGLENNVPIYVDGVYQADSVSINSDLANISSMQILKGPQGTLYGRNATGGAIVIETLDPADELGGNVAVSVGEFDDERYMGTLSGPLTDTLGFSVAGYTRKNDGYITEIGSNPFSTDDDTDGAPIESDSVRTKLKWTPTDDLALTLRYNYSFASDARGVAYTIFEYPSAFVDLPPYRADEQDELSATRPPNTKVTQDEVSGKIVWETEVGTLTSVTAYTERRGHSDYDFDASKTNTFLGYTYSPYVDQFTKQQSLDFYSDAIDRFDINIGGMYYSDHFSNDYQASLQGPKLIPAYYNFLKQETDAFAAYVDVTWQATEQLYLTAGARYSDEDKEFSYLRDNFGASANWVGDFDDNYSDVTPRFVARYELDADSNVYGSYTEGFRSGAFSPTSFALPEQMTSVDEEQIKAWEIGYKTATELYRLSTAAFYYDYTDLQVGATVNRGGTINQEFFSADDAEIYGAEVEFNYYVTDSLNLRTNIGYLHAEYQDFYPELGIATGLNSATNRNVDRQRQDWSGQEMARSPDWTANIGLDYTTELAEGSLTLAGLVRYSDSYVVRNLSLYGPLASPELQNKQRYRQDSYTTLSAQASWTDPSEHYTIGVYGDNLTDEEIHLDYSGSALTGDYGHYNWPRTWRVQVGYNF